MDPELRHELEIRKFDEPLTFHGCFDEGPDLRRSLRDFLGHIGLDTRPDLTETRLNALTELRLGSTAPATAANRSLALISDAQLADEIHERKQRRAQQLREDTRTAAQAEHLAGLPSQWRGKRYRPKEHAKNFR